MTRTSEPSEVINTGEAGAANCGCSMHNTYVNTAAATSRTPKAVKMAHERFHSTENISHDEANRSFQVRSTGQRFLNTKIRIGTRTPAIVTARPDQRLIPSQTSQR